jgi:hypothetical protein
MIGPSDGADNVVFAAPQGKGGLNRRPGADSAYTRLLKGFATMLEAYEHRSREVIELFFNRSIGFQACTAALNAAFTAIVTNVWAKSF